MTPVTTCTHSNLLKCDLFLKDPENMNMPPHARDLMNHLTVSASLVLRALPLPPLSAPIKLPGFSCRKRGEGGMEVVVLAIL